MANYITYGQDQADYDEFMLNAANNVNLYVNSQPWSDKVKRKWLDAYSEIMLKGITGALINSGGRWEVTHNGDPIDFSNKSEKEKSIYRDAAYFILLLMKPIKKEEEEKKELPIFDNATFLKELHSSISHDFFGGQDWHIGGANDLWNRLDERGENGVRGTNKRAQILANQLRLYSKNLLADKYNFEGSPFKNVDDLKGRIDDAIRALEDGNWDENDITALNRVGLNPSVYFNTGENDVYGLDTDGNPVTYQQYYQQQAAQLQATQQQAAEPEITEAQEAAPLFKSVQSSPRYGVISLPMSKLSERFGGDINKAKEFLTSLNGKPKLELNDWWTAKGMFDMYKDELLNLSEDELKMFSNLPLYKNLAPSRLKKIEGVDGIYYDTATDRVIRPSLDSEDALASLFASAKPMTEQDFLNSEIPGLTSADKKNLWAIGLDIASIVDPEPVSGAAFGIGAAGLRHSALNDIGHEWSFWDSIGQGIDYVTGAIGGLPLIGDTILGAKVLKGLGKVTPLLRKMARAGAWKDMIDGVLDGALTATYNKLVNGEDLTSSDLIAVGQLIRGLAGHRALNRSNLAERRTLEKSGYDMSKVTNSGWAKTGFVRTRVPGTRTLTFNVNGERVEMQISKESAAQLDKDLAKAGTNLTERNNAILKVPEVNKKYGSKPVQAPKTEPVKPAEAPKTEPTKPGEAPKEGEAPKTEGEAPKTEGEAPKTEAPKTAETPKVEALPSNWRDRKLAFWTNSNKNTISGDGYLRRAWNAAFDRNLDTGISQMSRNPEKDTFDEYIRNRNLWDKIRYGTNKLLNARRNALGLTTTPRTLSAKQEAINPEANTESIELQFLKEKFSRNKFRQGTRNIGLLKVTVQKVGKKDNKFNLFIDGKKVELIKGRKALLKRIFNIIEGLKKSILKDKLRDLFKDLNSIGWAKQGGTIDNNIITYINSKLL